MKFGKDDLRELTGKERLGQERQSEYLGAEDVDPGTEPVVTIAGIYNGVVTLQRGRENKDVLMFVEKSVEGIKHVRPLIVNATNRKALRKVYKTVDADTLKGKPIKLYIDHNVRDPETGGKTDGIRIRTYRPEMPREEALPTCADCHGQITPAYGKDARWVAAYTNKNYGVCLCASCAQKRKEAAQAAQNEAEQATAENTTEEVIE